MSYITPLFPILIKTRDGRDLIIREAEAEDAGLLLQHIEKVSGETSFLSFGRGEFEMTVEQEADFLDRCRTAENCIYLLAFVDQTLAGTLNFSSRNRSRLMHVGEFGMAIQRAFWGVGIGSMMLDALIDWARTGGVIKKINLKVRVDNAKALKLYFQKGFVVEGHQKKENFVDGVYKDLFHMGLIL